MRNVFILISVAFLSTYQNGTASTDTETLLQKPPIPATVFQYDHVNQFIGPSFKTIWATTYCLPNQACGWTFLNSGDGDLMQDNWDSAPNRDGYTLLEEVKNVKIESFGEQTFTLCRLRLGIQHLQNFTKGRLADAGVALRCVSSDSRKCEDQFRSPDLRRCRFPSPWDEENP